MPVRQKPISPDFFNFNDHTLRVVGREFSIENLDEFYPILLDGETCTLLEVRSETSRKAILGSTSSNDRYFLKQVPWYCDSEKRLTFSHAYQRHLHKIGLPVPKIHITKSSKSWVEVGGAKFVLFDFVPGMRYNGSIDQTAAAAAALADLHCVKLPSTIRLDTPEDLFTFTRDHVNLLRDSHHYDESKFQEYVQQLHSRVDLLRKNGIEAGWSSLDCQPVHGDYNPWNLLFSTDESIVAILDFDNCDYGPALHDVAEALVTFCAMRYRSDSTNFHAEPPDTWNVPRARKLLLVYSAIRPLTDAEKNCLPVIVELILVEFLCLGLIRGDYDLSCVSRYFQFMDTARDNIRQIIHSEE